MKKILIAVPVVFLLTACGAPSVEDLVKNPDKLSEISEKCMNLMKQGESTDTEECKNAKEAQVEVAKNMMKGVLGQ